MKKIIWSKCESGIDYKNHYDNTSDMTVANLAKNGLIVFRRTSETIVAFRYIITQITVKA